ncbi:MAG: electron transfer flavoprotein subunit beta/FixA family protein, partial [Ignavibacteriales bacterium]|nr:electron transfer flavoprotein subunit beta/FixA family protein [Ignavibacteriales bacterium]
IGTDGKSIDKTGINHILNPFDEFATEAILQLKEKNGGETIAITLGGDSHKETLRKALAMGVEKAILLKDDAVRDSFSIAKALSEELKKHSPEFILFGKQSIDYYDEQIPGLVAELLGVPSVTSVVKLIVEDKKITCHREIEGGQEIVETSYPVVIAAQKGLNEPRYPSLKGIMASKTKPILEVQPTPVQPVVELIGMQKPPAKQSGKIVGTDATAVPELVRLLHEEAKVI